MPRLLDAGHHVRVLSRHGHEAVSGVEYVTGDLMDDEGIEAAVDGADVIIHLAGNPKGDDEADEEPGAGGTAGRCAAPRVHLGRRSRPGPGGQRIDRAMFGYFAAKLAAEQIVADSGLPWTTLRATQFHDLHAEGGRQMSKLPVIPVPAGFRFQPVETGEVADRLVELALGAPAGLVPDIAGPRVYKLPDLLRATSGPAQAPAARARPTARQGCPGVPRRRESRSGSCRGSAHVGGLPRRAGPATGLSSGVWVCWHTCSAPLSSFQTSSMPGSDTKPDAEA